MATPTGTTPTITRMRSADHMSMKRERDVSDDKVPKSNTRQRHNNLEIVENHGLVTDDRGAIIYVTGALVMSFEKHFVHPILDDLASRPAQLARVQDLCSRVGATLTTTWIRSEWIHDCQKRTIY
jgi:hypothetical protein